jgi:NAD(P)-dependent dehydrogenase (short-subunit alcohol dehydrogenase family)
VTGAARERGIGRGIVRALAEEGCDVAINDVAAEEEAARLAAEIRATGRRALVVRADVADRQQVAEMLARTTRELGAPDIVCSNAGVAAWEQVVDSTEASWRRLVSVNLIGAFNVCQEGARAMIAAGRPGAIVVTSSVHVQMPFPSMSVYGATKSGLRAMVDVAAIELAPHAITVNHIGPGWVTSAINDDSPALQTPEDVEATLALIPAGRPADPRELGRAVVYLASDDGRYVTGEYLRIDGGFVVGKH